MRHFLRVCASALLVSGCSTVSSMEPYRVEVHDAALYEIDKNACRGYALAYSHGLSVSRIGESAAKSGAQNLASAAINPLVPALGALGGATSESLEEFGLTDVAQQRVFVKCLDKKTGKDGSALVLEPTP